MKNPGHITLDTTHTALSVRIQELKIKLPHRWFRRQL